MKRISLTNTAFEGNNNVYLFPDGSETVLVDTGDSSDETRKQLRAGLATYDLEFEDIDRILLTHWHHDHTGLAEEIQEASGASVHVHEADAPLVAGDEDTWTEMWIRMNDLFEAWEMPREKRERLQEFLQTPEQFVNTPSVTEFRAGEAFAVDDTDLVPVHVPGHAAGLCLFEMERDGGTEILSSDVLLPHYTPNVGGADVRVSQPLEKYLRGLDRIAEAGYRRAWPGHRDPIDDPAGRAREIMEHHRERSWRVLSVLDREGPCSVWDVSHELFGALESIHILHGPGEAYAHLDHLERQGDIERNGRDYLLTDETAAAVDNDTQTWPLNF